MTIAINPTTTIAELQANNTSAADSFPGWVNGMAKAGNVSHEPLGIPQVKLVHRCDWWGGSNHPNIGINCADAVYCAKTAADMKVRGLDGCLLDWYGYGHNTDKSLLSLRYELEKQGLKFALCVDGGIAAIKAATTDRARTDALLAALTYARAYYFTSPAYLKDGGKFVVLFFGFSTADFIWSTIRAALPECKLIFRWELNYSNRSYADGYFGWTHCDETWIQDVKKRAPGKLIFLGLNGGFDSSHKEDPIRCSWGSGNIIPQNGGLRMQEQLALAAAHPEIPYTSINTFNDYQEGSALEPGLASGQAITLTHGSGALRWSDPGQAFHHIELYVSSDGVKFMELFNELTIPAWVDLDSMDFAPGTYTFLVRAIGKPFVQNIVSNTLSATLAWK